MCALEVTPANGLIIRTFGSSRTVGFRAVSVQTRVCLWGSFRLRCRRRRRDTGIAGKAFKKAAECRLTSSGRDLAFITENQMVAAAKLPRHEMLRGRPKGRRTESPFPPNSHETTRPFGVTLMTTRGLPPLILEKGKPAEKPGRKAKGREIPGSLVAERMTPPTNRRREGWCRRGLPFCHSTSGNPHVTKRIGCERGRGTSV